MFTFFDVCNFLESLRLNSILQVPECWQGVEFDYYTYLFDKYFSNVFDKDTEVMLHLKEIFRLMGGD